MSTKQKESALHTLFKKIIKTYGACFNTNPKLFDELTDGGEGPEYAIEQMEAVGTDFGTDAPWMMEQIEQCLDNFLLNHLDELKDDNADLTYYNKVVKFWKDFRASVATFSTRVK